MVISFKNNGDELEVTVKIKLTGTMMEMEDTIQASVNEVGKIATGEALSRFDTTGNPIQIADIKLTSKGQEFKEYQTPYGAVLCKRHVYQTSKGGKIYCPLDERARILKSSTPKFARIVSSKYASLNAVEAMRDLKDNHGRTVAHTFIQDVADMIGSIAEATEEKWEYSIPEQKDAVSTVGISLDGTCVLMREDGYREAMTGNISLYNPEGERLHTIYIGASPEYGKQTFLNKLTNEIKKIKLKYPQANYVGIADGAKSNWPFLEQHTTNHIVDFYHATEYLAKASYAFAKDEDQRKQWKRNACHQLKHEENAAKTLLNIMKMKNTRKLTKDNKAKLESAITYFENQQHRMSYVEYRNKQFPIGSGVTEAACKTLIKQRLCRSGMKWKDRGARIVIGLRALIQTTDRWSQFWEKINQNGISGLKLT